VRALGAELFVPEGNATCGADIALVRLDRSIDDVEPFDIGALGVAEGDHVDGVGYGDGDSGGLKTKLIREHATVLAVTPTEVHVAEATCGGEPGGPAFDETTGEVVGVVSRSGPRCDGDGAYDVYTRVDPFAKIIEDALASSRANGGDAGAATDAGTHRRHTDAGRGHGHKPKSNIGAACKKGSECATGICVADHGKHYCSRTCDAKDACPTHFACTKTRKGEKVCTEK
jgi:hypothetical protein